jgi:Winged helix-turn helix
VATVIERLTGVHYHPGHVWYLLRRLNWWLQLPARRARERDEPAIHQWVRQPWPAVKKSAAAARLAPLRGRKRVLDAACRPPHVAPRGETPVLIHPFGPWERLSVAAALAFRWDGRRGRLFFQTHSGPYTTPSLIGFLRQLKRHC